MKRAKMRRNGNTGRTFSWKAGAAVCAVLLIGAMGSVTAAEVASWTNSKTGSAKRMFLVSQGEKVTFRVRGPESCRWFVNKKIQEESKPAFKWTVPGRKGIWEVRAEGGESYAEWVVSTLPREEAPDFFDYFTDGKIKGRQETDPWGRKLPEWNGRDYSKDDVLKSAVRGYFYPGNARIQTTDGGKPIYGTWRFRVKFDRPSRGVFGLGVEGDNGKPGDANKVNWSMNKTDSIHWYFGTTARWFPLIRAMGSSSRGWFDFSKETLITGPTHADIQDTNWHLVTIVHSKEGWWRVWLDREFVNTLMANSDFMRRAHRISINARRGTSIDGLEFYDGRTVHPAEGSKDRISYRKYIDVWEYPGYKKTNPVWDEGIVIEGDNIRLAEIAKAVNDPSKFRYDPRTKTADCYTNLVVKGGSELVLEGETLRMHSNRDGEYRIRVKTAATVKVINSKITSANEHYYIWAFAGPELAQPFWEYGKTPGAWGIGWGPAAHYMDFDGRFIVENSTIENCGNISLQGAGEIIIRNSRFLDLVDARHGFFKGFGERLAMRVQSKEKKAFWINNFLPIHRFEIDNVTFRGKQGRPPVTIGITGGGKTVSEQCLENVRLENARLLVRRTLLPVSHASIRRRFDNPVVGLVNCDFGEVALDLETSEQLLKRGYLGALREDYPGARSTRVTPSYYLDVRVINVAGQPVRGATVKVTNEVDNVLFPAESFDCLNREPTYVSDLGFGYDTERVHRNQLRGYPWFERLVKTALRPEYIPALLEAGAKEPKYVHEKIVGPLNPVYDARKRLTGFYYFTQGSSEDNDTYIRYDIRIKYNKRGLVESYEIVGGTVTRDLALKSEFLKDGGGRWYNRLANYFHEFDYKYDEAGNVLSYVETCRNNEKGMRKYILWRREVVSAVKTGKDGRTPLPSDRKHSLVLADYTLSRDNPEMKLKKKEFTYTIEVFAGGRKKKITGVNPGPNWYRPDLDVSTYTITAVLDGKTETEAELKKKGLAGRLTGTASVRQDKAF